MRDLLADIDRWRTAGDAGAVAAVVEAWGSAPRGAGGKMAMTADGRIAGSVSGGCVETAVIEAGKEVLASGRPRLLHYGVSDEKAWSVGLACGGSIDVFVDPLAPELYERLRAAVEAHRAAAVATVIRGPEEVFGQRLLLVEDGTTLGVLPEEARAAAAAALSTGLSRRMAIPDGEIFIDVLRPPPRLVVVGGVHIAIPLG